VVTSFAMAEPIDKDPPMRLQQESFYLVQFDVLTEIATSQFSMPSVEAERMASEVLLSAVRHMSGVTDLGKWLEGAMRCAARRFKEDAK